MPLHSLLPFKFRKLFSIFSLSCSFFYWLLLVEGYRPIRDINLGVTHFHILVVSVLFTNRASSDCSWLSSLPCVIILKDHFFFSLCSANSLFCVVIIINQKFITFGVISWFLVSRIKFSVVLLLSPTAMADAYDNIRLPLFKAFELSFSSIMFLRFIWMLLN